MEKLFLLAFVCIGGVSIASGASKHTCYLCYLDRSAMCTHSFCRPIGGVYTIKVEIS